MHALTPQWFCHRGTEKQEVSDHPQSAKTGASEQHSAEAEERVPPNSKPVAVLFGTEYGFSKEIAKKLSARLRETSKYW